MILILEKKLSLLLLLPPIAGTLSKMLVNKYSLGLQDPVTSAIDKYLSLLHVSYELIGDVKGEGYFSTANHLLAIDGNYPFSVTTASGVIAITPFWG